MVKYLVRFISLGLFSSAISAEPMIIFDSGKTVPADKYAHFFTTDIQPSFITNGWVFNDEPVDNKGTDVPGNVAPFPIRTSKMSPARIEKTKEKYIASMPGPMCIVGSDPLSKQWITRNYKYLRESKVMCVIVQAENESEARELAMMLNGLLVNLGDGDALADYFKIEHYPVLITERSISQ